jgi:ESF2/ABP1 family protein
MTSLSSSGDLDESSSIVSIPENVDSNSHLKVSKKVIQSKDVSDFQSKTDQTGLVYMSYIPPFMGPGLVRKLLSGYGTIGRIYLALEDAKSAMKRKKYKGNSRKNYKEGWIEFLDKREGKIVAKELNNTMVGGKTLSKYHDSLWSMKYLPKFKWHHLTEQIGMPSD